MNKELLKILLVGVLVTIAAFWLAFRFVQPAPPRAFTIAAGPEGGAYLAFAHRYQAALAEQGIEVTVVPTSGSVENVTLLGQPDGVDVAFVQTGIPMDAAPDVSGLAALYYEPLWIFTRTELAIERWAELVGLRMATGPAGSGTQSVVDALMTEHKLSWDEVNWVPQGGDEAWEALAAGAIDGVFLVAAVGAPAVQRYLEVPDLQLAQLSLVPALSRRLPFLTHVEIARGLLDPASEYPAETIAVLAPVASLVARDDFHPALVDLLLTVVQREHREGDLLSAPGSFPRMDPVAAPISAEAERFFTAGLPFLKRILPFWAATLIARMWVMVIPLLTILIPLMKIVPPTYHWRLRSQVFRLYRRLKAVDAERMRSTDGEAAAEARAEWLQTLDQIEAETEQLNVPLSYADRVYHLKLHIRFVKDQLS